MSKQVTISVVIPTYKSPEALDLCLRSAIEGQVNQNELIVVVDGFYDLNRDVLLKHKDAIQVLDLKENLGLCKGVNYGVYNATSDLVLVVNDDNVFPKRWDVKLRQDYQEGCVFTPNQVEPNPSIYPQFNIKDLGRNPITFDLKTFQEYEESISHMKWEETGGTFPFLISKRDFMRVGGWDENYPMGLISDWDFFYKCQLTGLRMMRTYTTHMYHFESLTTRKTPQMSRLRDQLEIEASHYAKYKWGGVIINGKDNQKYIQKV